MYYLPRSKGLPVLLTLPVTGEPGLDGGVREEMVVEGIGSLLCTTYLGLKDCLYC